jgi:myo-inositol-1(or 4)-monophosphatase
MHPVAQKDWNVYADFARELAALAGSTILPLFRNPLAVDNKLVEGFDPVTEADRSAEQAMRRMITASFPDHGIIGEEFEPKPARSEFCWVLDPIDGTRSFICGMPTWTTLIALVCQERPILGIVSQPFVGELFIGGPYGSWCERGSDRRGLSVHPAAGIGSAILTTVAPEIYRSEKQRRVLHQMCSRTRMTRFGGDAYFFVMLASGFVDIAMDAGLAIYDIAALVPIIEGAGGIVTTWDGGDASRGGDILAAGSAGLHASALALMKSC